MIERAFLFMSFCFESARYIMGRKPRNEGGEIHFYGAFKSAALYLSFITLLRVSFFIAKNKEMGNNRGNHFRRRLFYFQ